LAAWLVRGSGLDVGKSPCLLFEKGGETSERQKMLSTYARVISFTTEVVAFLLLVERRTAG